MGQSWPRKISQETAALIQVGNDVLGPDGAAEAWVYCKGEQQDLLEDWMAVRRV